MTSAHCPRCGSPLDLPEPVVQRIELVGGEPVRDARTLEIVRYERSDLMVSFEAATVAHHCPTPDVDKHQAFDTNEVALPPFPAPTRRELR